MSEPLAERMRPKSLDDYIGQEDVVGKDSVLRKMLAVGRMSSFILWGPPGVGKTTLAHIVATSMKVPFYTLSAVSSGVKDVRDVIMKAEHNRFFNSPSPILFIDEIHRFSKSQQDSLLGAVEKGTITLIGATTENPSFEVIRPLLSRCQLYVLKELTKENLLALLERALSQDVILSKQNIELKETDALLRYSGGDARKLLSLLELVTVDGVHAEGGKAVIKRVQSNGCIDYAEREQSRPKVKIVITDELVKNVLQSNPLAYDKGGEMHYDIISAFIKSIRGSDPDAALYWMARMIDGGEQPEFIARRMIISASEDIGLANPNALLLANAAFDAVMKIGWPEARITLAECAVYLARSKKDNSAYLGIEKALGEVKNSGNLPVPLHLRNAPTKLMADLGYSDGYKYPHDYPGHYVEQQYLPDELKDSKFIN